MKNFFGHLRNILVHKFWVMHYGRKIGVGFWQLFKHDLSKFSLIEFRESLKYYQGTSSPIPVCKSKNGYSEAWQHHKGRNPHHYEYWTDNYDSGMTLIPIPFKYVEELLADWFAAGRTYQGSNFSVAKQAVWWQAKKKTNMAIHPETIKLIDAFFEMHNDEDIFKKWKENRRYWSWCYWQYIKGERMLSHPDLPYPEFNQIMDTLTKVTNTIYKH